MRLMTRRRYKLEPVVYHYGDWIIKRSRRGKWFFHKPGKGMSIHFDTVIAAIRAIHVVEDQGASHP